MSSQENPSNGVIAKYLVWFEELAPREQKLLFWGIPLTCIFVSFLLFIEPAWKDAQQLQNTLDRLSKQHRLGEANVAELMAQATVDPNLEVKQQIQSLHKRMQSIDEAFDAELQQLIAPKSMPSVLADVFEQADGLTLLSMSSAVPQPLFAQSNSAKPIYRHGLEIIFDGSFFATRDFLSQAEALPWKLYWQEMRYEVSDYPNAQTTLFLFTLSTSEVFISVE